MVILIPKSFSPSDVLIRMSGEKNMYEITKEQVKYHFISVVSDIRNRVIYDSLVTITNEFWLIDHNYIIRPEFLKSLKSRIRNDDFVIDDRFKFRLAEEILCWYFKYPNEALKQGIKIDKFNRLVVERQETFIY